MTTLHLGLRWLLARAAWIVGLRVLPRRPVVDRTRWDRVRCKIGGRIFRAGVLLWDTAPGVEEYERRRISMIGW